MRKEPSTECKFAFIFGLSLLAIMMCWVPIEPTWAGGPVPQVPTQAELDADLSLKANKANSSLTGTTSMEAFSATSNSSVGSSTLTEARLVVYDVNANRNVMRDEGEQGVRITRSITLADAASITIPDDLNLSGTMGVGAIGVLTFVVTNTPFSAGSVWLKGTGDAVTIIDDPASNISVTDAGTSVAIFPSGTTGKYTFKNRRGGTSQFYIEYIGSK